MPHLVVNEQISRLFKHPLLRSSSTVEGIFHEGVVVCEADSDCLFYGALQAQIEASGDVPSDLYFTHGAGKSSISLLVEAYATLGVRVAVIADLDLLRHEQEFKRVLKGLGGDFDGVAKLYKQVAVSLRAQGPKLKAQEVIDGVESVLSELKARGGLEQAQKRRIEELLSDGAEWSESKFYGIERLRGEAHVQARRLLTTCEETGLFLVPKGEMEGWWRAGPPEKQVWIQKAIEHISAEPANFREAREFVSRVSTYLLTPHRSQ